MRRASETEQDRLRKARRPIQNKLPCSTWPRALSPASTTSSRLRSRAKRPTWHFEGTLLPAMPAWRLPRMLPLAGVAVGVDAEAPVDRAAIRRSIP
jgi:hypothetical protein